MQKNGSADAEVFLNDSLSSTLSQGHLDSLTSLETGEEDVINRKHVALSSIFVSFLQEHMKDLSMMLIYTHSQNNSNINIFTSENLNSLY